MYLRDRVKVARVLSRAEVYIQIILLALRKRHAVEAKKFLELVKTAVMHIYRACLKTDQNNAPEMDNAVVAAVSASAADWAELNF
jgi:hypothetical protein